MFASVDIVSKEKVVCLGGKATVLKQAKKVVVLAVDITANLQTHGKVSVGCFP